MVTNKLNFSTFRKQCFQPSVYSIPIKPLV